MSDLERELMELGNRVSDSVRPSHDMADRVFRRARRRRMINSVKGALVVGVVGLASFAAAGSFGDSPQQDPVAPQPSSASPAPTESPTDGGGRDIGLGFRVCFVSRLGGIDLLGDGTAGAAWTATRMTDEGRCKDDLYNRYLVAVDVTGDGMADAQWEPLKSCFECRPFGAADFDADGDEELVVRVSGGTITTYLVFSAQATAGSTEVAPLVVAAPGNPDARLPAGEPFGIWVGGDEGFSGSVSCTNYPEDPSVTVAWSNHAVDGPGDETTEIHITDVVLRDGAFHITGSLDTEQPTEDPLPKAFRSSNVACGVDFNLFSQGLP